ncbi:MAG: polyphosphate kinase 1 [Bacteroidales bacterium]|jgi:polyphosphate kinase|nr:polyphosphate kinase 1 [Bacteroidales bacterium]
MAATKKEQYINREVSWLHFNERVLQEAMDEGNPIIERLKFLGIFSNNRDEFFRVRVATIKRLALVDISKRSKFGDDPELLLKEIQQIVEDQEKKFTDTFIEIKKALEKENIIFRNENNLSFEQGKFVRKFFHDEVRPFLFPIMLNNLESPDFLRDNTIYLALELKDSTGEKEDDYAIVIVPTDDVSRFVLLPGKEKKYLMFLDDVIRYAIGEIFNPFGYDEIKGYTIKFTRDAELDFDNDVSKSFIELMSESIKRRKKGLPVRFVYDENIPDPLLKKLTKKLQISEVDNIRGGSKYHNFRDFMSFPKIGSKHLVNRKTIALNHKLLPRNKSILEAIKNQDILLHYPYQSFQYIVDLLREAAIDPKVKAIKMTFYRAARNSNVMDALINAARNGKNITVFLEIQARFDEEANIYWIEKLTDEGVKIIKTLPGFKVHSKLLLIRRKEEGENIYYANISTGNFNESTAKVYADDSLLTANQDIAKEINTLFHLFESPYNPPKFKHLLVAPYYIRNSFIRLINKEIKNAKQDKEAWVIIKLNSITDKKIVKKLYAASKAGVKIRIICRGICILIPEVKKLSENIEVISIVDKYLEHSRVFVFGNDGNPKYYLASSDWMVRNFDHRFEVACPVYDENLQREIMDMLQIQLADNVKARYVNTSPNNQYKEATTPNELPLRSQLAIYNYLMKYK